jgi:hypothetical protein
MPPEKYRAGIFTCKISDLLFATRTGLHCRALAEKMVLASPRGFEPLLQP